MNRDAMSLTEVVLRLIGPIDARGESSGDRDRLENCKALSALLHDLLREVRHNTDGKDSYEDSVKQIGSYCESMLDSLAEYSTAFNGMAAKLAELENSHA